MIERQQQKSHSLARRCWQASFALLLATVIVFEAAPQLTANALYLLTDSISTVVAGGAERVESDRIVLAGAKTGETDVILEPNKKVTIRRAGDRQYATSRENETVSDLLRREGVSIGPLEMVRVDLSGNNIVLEIASDFTYYETVAEASAFTTVYTTDYTMPKGETKIIQQGKPGWRDVTYEVVYADGAFVSRQAVAEENNTTVTELASVGTLVTEAQEGDTIAQVMRNDDGSGYLIMKSGDSLHFTGSMDVTCTAYTANVGKVGTITYTGTTVHPGVVAVDKSVIPLGTKMFITTAKGDITYGMGVAEDTGVRGKAVDLYMNTRDECMEFGRRSSIVYFLDA